MLPEKRDAAFLWDMRDAASDIIGWVQGVSYAVLQQRDASLRG
jgi:hypothetical protein